MTPAGKARLKADEGLRQNAYQDSGGVWTIGYGCMGDGIGPGVYWTLAQCDAALDARVAEVESGFRHDLPWFAGLDPVRQDVMENIGYNVGVYGEEHWPSTLAHIRDGQYAAAAHDLLNEGKWNIQVGARATRLAAAMLNGSWSPTAAAPATALPAHASVPSNAVTVADLDLA